MTSLSREDRAWLAGFFEGEGSIVASAKAYHVSLRITQVEPWPLLQIDNILPGFGRIYGPYPSHMRVSKDGYNRQGTAAWVIQRFDKVETFAGIVWPWLSPRRKQQIRTALETYTARVRYRPYGKAVA